MRLDLSEGCAVIIEDNRRNELVAKFLSGTLAQRLQLNEKDIWCLIVSLDDLSSVIGRVQSVFASIEETSTDALLNEKLMEIEAELQLVSYFAAQCTLRSSQSVQEQ
jgi:hypothetical protein